MRKGILAIQKLDDLLLVGTSGLRVTDDECLRLDMTRTGPSARFMGIVNPYLAAPWVMDSVADDSVVIEETRVSPGIGRLGGALRSGVGPSARTSAEPTANTPALIASTATNAAAAMCHFLIVGIEKFKAGLL